MNHPYNYRLPHISFALILFFICNISFAQPLIVGFNNGSGNAASFPTPYGDSYEGQRAQYLYTAAELALAGAQPGLITKIGFIVSAANGAALDNFSIRLSNTTATDLSETLWEPAGDLVYDETTLVPSVGNNLYDLESDFFWNGFDNLLVEICHNPANPAGGAYSSLNAAVTLTTGMLFNGSASRPADDDPSACAYEGIEREGIANSRPQLLLEFACVAPVSFDLLGKTSVSAQFFVTHPFDGFAQQKFQWEVGAPNFLPGTMTEYKKGIAAFNTFWINGLQSLTEYDVYVRTLCSNGEYSDWFGPIGFMTLPGCGDSYFDTGGSADAYSNDENYEEVLCADSANHVVTLTFSGIEVLAGDTLRVYNGASSSSPILATLSGTYTTPLKYSSTTVSGCLTVQFSSDAIGTGAGWSAGITCGRPDSCFSTIFPRVSNIRPDRATFFWEPMFNVRKYEWRIGEAPYNPNQVPFKSDSVFSASSVVVNGLFQTTFYEFYIRSVCNFGGTSGWKKVEFFTPPNCNEGLIVCGGTYTFPKVKGKGVYNAPICLIDNRGKERVTRFTAPNTRTYTFAVTATTNPAIGVGYYIKSTEVGCGPNDWACIGNFTGLGSVETGLLVAGREYYIRFDPIDGSDSIQQTIQITGCTPTNDDAVTAIDLEVGVTCGNNIYGVNQGSASPGEPDPDVENILDPIAGRWSASINRTVWFKFEAPPSGTVIIQTNKVYAFTDLDTRVSLYEVKIPGSYGSFRYIESDDNSGTDADAALSYSGLTPGQTYYIQMDANGAQINDAFCIEVLEGANINTADDCTKGYPRGGINGIAPGGNNWYDVYTNPDVLSGGFLVAAIKPGAQILDTVWVKVQHESGIITHLTLPFLPIFHNFVSKIAPVTNTQVRMFFNEEDFEALKTAANRPTATIADLKALFYKGPGQNCIVGDNTEPPGDTAILNIAGAVAIGTSGWFWVDVSIPDMGEVGIFLPPAPILPLDLLAFSGKTAGTANRLNWRTQNERKVRMHVVERSADNFNWLVLGQKTPVGGIGNAIANYEFNDLAPIAEAYYRIRFMDDDGKYQLSNSIRINRKDKGFAINRVYPSPSPDWVNIQFVVDHEGDVQLMLSDLTGKLLLSQTVAVQEGLNLRPISLSHLPNGIYLVQLRSAEGISAPVKVLKE